MTKRKKGMFYALKKEELSTLADTALCMPVSSSSACQVGAVPPFSALKWEVIFLVLTWLLFCSWRSAKLKQSSVFPRHPTLQTTDPCSSIRPKQALPLRGASWTRFRCRSAYPACFFNRHAQKTNAMYVLSGDNRTFSYDAWLQMGAPSSRGPEPCNSSLQNGSWLFRFLKGLHAYLSNGQQSLSRNFYRSIASASLANIAALLSFILETLPVPKCPAFF